MSKGTQTILVIAGIVLLTVLIIPALLTLDYLYDKLNCYYHPKHTSCERIR